MYSCLLFFFFNATAPTEIYTLSLHDALPISVELAICICTSDRDPHKPLTADAAGNICAGGRNSAVGKDRKSTRLNSSHVRISYAVFCLKKKKKNKKLPNQR